MNGSPPPFAVLMETLPRSLVDLLTRELAFVHARAQLTKTLEDARQQLRMLKATRSPFFLLQSQDVRRDARTSQAEAESAIDVCEKGLARLDQTEPLLKAFVAYRLETYLRASSQDYVQALLERRQVEDWQRWLAWFEHYCSVFRSTLSLLEATLASLPPSQTLAQHPQCAVLLSQAIEGAKQIEAEISFFNQVADAERRMIGVGSHCLYRQLELDWCGAMRSLGTEDGRQGPAMVGHFIGQFTDIARNISRALQDECAQPVSAQTLETNSFHARQWNTLRELIAPHIAPGKFDEIARETEQLLANGRIAELARAREELMTASAPASAAQTAHTDQAGAGVAPSETKTKPVLQLRARRSVTGVPFGNTPPATPGDR